MSGICAVLRLDDGPVDPGVAGRMLEGLAGWGESPCARVSDSRVAAVACRLQRITPEDAYESQPLATPQADLLLVADARIDNRTELFADLGIRAEDRDRVPDSALILAAWAAWGEDAPRRLLGDFVFIVWDERRRTLFAVRDAMGQRGLFLHRTRERLVLASSTRAILAAGDVPVRLNEQKVADFLVQLEDPASTYYQGVERLPPGHVLVASAAGDRLRRYWSPVSGRRINLGSDEAYLENFRAVFDDAVRARLRTSSTVGVMLSGGLDSSAVAGTAAELLRPAGRRLAAFHAAPGRTFRGEVRKGWIADETADVEAIAAMHANLDLRILRPDGTTPLDYLEDIFETVGGPVRNPSNLAWVMGLFRTAAARRINVMLTGQKGNSTISFTGLRCLRDLARRGHILRAMAEARAVARTRGQRSRDVVRDQVIRPLLPAKVVDWIRRIRGRSSSALWDAESTAISPAFAREMRVDDRLRAHRWDDESVDRAGAEEYRALVLTATGDGMDIPHTFRARFGIESRDPTSDLRVIDFCLAIPGDQYLRNGRDRLLVRRGMRDRLPHSLLQRTTRGAQAADWADWFGLMRPGFAAEIERLERLDSARRCLDIPRLRRLIENWPERLGAEHMLEYNLVLLRAIMMGRFLRWFEEKRA